MLPAGQDRPHIKLHCDPNALSTFREYLRNFASPETRAIGNQLIADAIAGMTGIARQRAEKLVSRVDEGRDDVYC